MPNGHITEMRLNTKLKDAELFGLDRPVRLRGCDCAGCAQPGDYKAPKGRNQLQDYYWFCLEHVREYNLNWDYYRGMSQMEIEAEIRNDSCWQRETRPLGNWRKKADALRDKVAQEFFADEDTMPPSSAAPSTPAAAVAALRVLELQPPADFAQIKAQYRILVKKYHPDLHGGGAEADARLKDINLAFTTLRQIYGA